jgi:hypothetical protein
MKLWPGFLGILPYVPDVLEAFIHAWRLTFEQGVLDNATPSSTCPTQRPASCRGSRLPVPDTRLSRSIGPYLTPLPAIARIV